MEGRAFGNTGIGDDNLLWPDPGEQAGCRALIGDIQNMACDQGVGCGHGVQWLAPPAADMDPGAGRGEVGRQHLAKAAAAASHKDTAL